MTSLQDYWIEQDLFYSSKLRLTGNDFIDPHKQNFDFTPLDQTLQYKQIRKKYLNLLRKDFTAKNNFSRNLTTNK